MGPAVSNVYLVGPMGSGKTTIGRRLAQKLGYDFYDCDREIEQRTGVSVALIFEIEGEAGFRRREAAMLQELGSRHQAVVATGGGAVLDAANRQLMQHTGTVVYLQTPVRKQYLRLRRDRSRPLLQSRERRRVLEELAALRTPLYEEIADLTFPARSGSIEKTVQIVHRALQRHIGTETATQRVAAAND